MSTNEPTLTPDGVAFARFLSEATVDGGLAVANAILAEASFISHMLDSITPEEDVCIACEEEHRAENEEALKHLFPFVRAIQPETATNMALEYPFLWEVHDAS
jgi:hypothetical protein